MAGGGLGPGREEAGLQAAAGRLGGLRRVPRSGVAALTFLTEASCFRFPPSEAGGAGLAGVCCCECALGGFGSSWVSGVSWRQLAKSPSLAFLLPGDRGSQNLTPTFSHLSPLSSNTAPPTCTHTLHTDTIYVDTHFTYPTCTHIHCIYTHMHISHKSHACTCTHTHIHSDVHIPHIPHVPHTSHIPHLQHTQHTHTPFFSENTDSCTFTMRQKHPLVLFFILIFLVGGHSGEVAI